MSASIRATVASSALFSCCRCTIAKVMPEARGRHGAAERARHRRQRHHGRQCCEPALAEHPGALLRLRCGTDAVGR